MFAAERALRGFQKSDQHRVLTLGQRDLATCGIDELPGSAIELPAGKSKPATLRIRRRRGLSDIEPPQYGADACKQLTQVERLGEIVVGAELETNHAIDVIATVARDDDDRHFRARADLAKQIQSVLGSKPQIEYHKVRLGLAKAVDHLLTVVCHMGADVVLRKI